MKVTLQALIVISLILVFSGCTKRPYVFNKNNKGIIFSKGTPYRIPHGTNYRLFNPQDKKLFIEESITTCNLNDMLWGKTSAMITYSEYDLFFKVLQRKSLQNNTLDEVKILFQKTYKNEKYKTKFLIVFNDLSQLSSYDIKIKDLFNNILIKKYIINFNKVFDYKMKIRKGLVGCSHPMSNREYNYYVGNQRQRAKFKHEKDIQGQKSLDKSFDRLNDTFNNMTPKTYNINHSGSVNVKHY